MNNVVKLAAAVAFCVPAIAGAQQVQPMEIVVYEAGPNWAEGQAPDKQDLGGHFAYVGGQMQEGNLRAFGLQTDAIRGYYVVPGGTADSFVANDPAAESGVLTRQDAVGWAMVIDAMPPVAEPRPLTMLWYEPGPEWQTGKPLTEQDIASHMAWIGERVADGTVLAGGPLTTTDGGLYVIAATDEADVQSFIEADPGVKLGVFTPRATGWMVLGAMALD